MTDSQTLGGDEKEKKVFLGDEEKLFEYFGALKRSAGAILGQGGIEKCAGLHINTAGTLLAAQSTGKIVEVRVETSYLTQPYHPSILRVLHLRILVRIIPSLSCLSFPPLYSSSPMPRCLDISNRSTASETIRKQKRK